MTPDYAASLLTQGIEAREDILFRCRIEAAKQSYQPPKPPSFSPVTKYINEMELQNDGTWSCLVSYTTPDISPEWCTLDDLPPGLSNKLILSKEYETFVGAYPYYTTRYQTGKCLITCMTL